MTDMQLNENLLNSPGKKNKKEYNKKFEECELLIKTLKNKNNQIQKQSENDLEGDVRKAIKQQCGFIEAEINKIKKLLLEIGQKYPDLQTKNKLKKLAKLAADQIERNKRITSQIVNRASSGSFILGKGRQSRQNKAERRSRSQYENKDNNSQNNNMERKISEVDEEYLPEDEIISEQRIQKQRKELLSELELKNNEILDIMNDIGRMVGGQQKDLIHDMTNHNEQAIAALNSAGGLLDEAALNQRKAKKKYTICVAIIVLVVIVVGGIVYFQWGNS